MISPKQEKVELEEQLALLQEACDEETDLDRLHAVHIEIDEISTQLAKM